MAVTCTNKRTTKARRCLMHCLDMISKSSVFLSNYGKMLSGRTRWQGPKVGIIIRPMTASRSRFCVGTRERDKLDVLLLDPHTERDKKLRVNVP